MDLAALEIFRTVAEQGSVTRAGLRLGRVQSNVTKRVQQLEEELGTALFLRERKRMVLTPAGHLFSGYADRLLALADEAREALRPQRATGVLRLGAMESTAATRLPGPLAHLHAQCPELVVELSTGPSRMLLDQVLDQTLDGAFMAWPSRAWAESGLWQAMQAAPVEHTRVYAEALLLALPAQHPPVHTAADVRVTALAALGPGCVYRSIGHAYLLQGTGQPPRVLEQRSYHAILAAVTTGHFAGVVPQSVIDQLQNPPPLRLVDLTACDTVLVRRRGCPSAALDTLLAAVQRPSEPPAPVP